jgi:hypothetical protein
MVVVKKEISDAQVRQNIKKQERTIAQKLNSEKKVGVMGLEIYAQYLGTTYTFLLNGIPVSIKLNGTEQFYPESVAKLLKNKLNAIGRSNTRRVVNVEI